jgi:hypothetical protein
MKWTTKAFIQRTLAHLPGSQPLYYLGQRHFGSLSQVYIERKVRQGLNLLTTLYEAGGTIEGRHTVEFGSGWVPVVPLLFWLYGQETCHSYDVTRLLRPSLVVMAARQLVEMAADPKSALSQWSLASIRPERQQQLAKAGQQGATGQQILVDCGFIYHAPTDTAATGLAAESVDIVFSNTVLEHVPPDQIRRLIEEARRILRPGGCMLHQIDPSDHFSHGDPSISAVNFLQFSQKEFDGYNTIFLYQNRLRAPDYRRLLLEHCFEIVCWQTQLNEKALGYLSGSTLKVHPAFADFTAEELCITAIRLVARVA